MRVNGASFVFAYLAINCVALESKLLDWTQQLQWDLKIIISNTFLGKIKLKG